MAPVFLYKDKLMHGSGFFIADELTAGNTVELRNFGVFKIVTCKSRKGRNPNQPKNEVIIPERCVVKFRAGKELKARIEALKPKTLKK